VERRAALGRFKQSVTDAELAKSLMSEGLVEEYYLMVTPSVQGDGKRFFDTALLKLDLELRPLDVGSVCPRRRKEDLEARGHSAGVERRRGVSRGPLG
jgi:hypothetical protein